MLGGRPRLELVSVVANMAEAALVGATGERPPQDHPQPPGACRDHLRAPVDACPGARHTESTARQYGLADQAVRLGWPRARVEVVDADLGLSGRSAEHRAGFRELVGRVCVGEVGAIFGLEISRLARSSADLSRLLELARLTDTLVIDADGVYDLGDFNDRLLLGLKSTMSEAELHVLAGRLQGAKRAAAERGELRFPLPVGYVYDDDGGTVIDPDQEVSTAVADVFAAFRARGSAYGVVAAFKG
jgi:DNA invertase Pin-like site-specific DNA recombinase